jgi:sec-independent protein translocase protein TatA
VPSEPWLRAPRRRALSTTESREQMGLDNPLHILILLLVVLLVFGAKRLPEVGRSLGEGMRGFKETLHATASAPALEPPIPLPLADTKTPAAGNFNRPAA